MDNGYENDFIRSDAGRSESVATLVQNYSSDEKNLEHVNYESLQHKLFEAESLVKRYEDENFDLRAELAVYKDKENEFKRQLEAMSSLIISDGSHQRSVDLQRVYDQLLYKDSRIVELNNLVLEKERQIMDLQESVREQGEVAQSKNKAVQIVNKRLQELDGKHTKDASTETDVGMIDRIPRNGRKQRVVSPGRAIPQLKIGGNGSPPPLDPAEDMSSYTTETATYDDPDREWSPSPYASAGLNRISKKYRKKVTFDLKPGGNKLARVKKECISPDAAKVSMQGVDNEIAQQIIDLTNENDELRRIIAEIERAPVPEQDMKIAQLEEELENARKYGKNQLLRARASAQAKMKELEGKMLELQEKQALEVDSLNATNEALKSGRDFVLDENAKLLEERTRLKQKDVDLRSELDGSMALTLNYRRELDMELRRISELRSEIKAAEHSVQMAFDEKQLAYAEVDKLKDALFAQDELIKMLEGDLIVYETQVGMLRDTLGATKVGEREEAKNKAATAKVSALDVEKDDLIKKRNDEKLKTKALHVKIRYLEQERDELLQWIQKHSNFDFPLRSLEDLKRLQANRGYGAASNSDMPASSYSSVFTAPTVLSTNFSEEPSFLNLTQDSEDVVGQLTKELETARSVNERLEAELAAKSMSTHTIVPDAGDDYHQQPQGFLQLIETVENISMIQEDNKNVATMIVPEIVDAIPVDSVCEVTNLQRQNSDLRGTNKDLNEQLNAIKNQLSAFEDMKQATENAQKKLFEEKASVEQDCRELQQKLKEKEEQLFKSETENEINSGSSAEWMKEISTLKIENQALVDVKEECERNFAQLQDQYHVLQTSYSQMQEYYEAKAIELNVEKEQLVADLQNYSERLQTAEQKAVDYFEDSVRLEQDRFVVEEKNKGLERAIKQMDENKSKFLVNEQELIHLRNQIERMDNDYNQLRDTNSKLERFLTEARTSLAEAEATRNSLASENRHLQDVQQQLETALSDARKEHSYDQERERVYEIECSQSNDVLVRENHYLEEQLHYAEDNINENTERVVNSTLALVDDEFDDARDQHSSKNAETQCVLIGEPQTMQEVEQQQPHLNDMLLNYVKETSNFNEFIGQDVENLFVLNNELASAADSLKGQVWALNEQLKKSMFERQEILEQMEKLEGDNSTVFDENQRLKQELEAQQMKLDEIGQQNSRWKDEVKMLQDRKAEVEQAYEQLSDKYSQLQTAYDNVLTRLMVPKHDASTDPLLEKDFFLSAEGSIKKYEQLEVASNLMRKDLEAQTIKMKTLEQMIHQNVSSVNAAFDSYAVQDNENLRGAKMTAHSAMLEIKKLLVEAADTLQKLPIDEAYDTVRKETELRCSERVKAAIQFCETVFAEMESCESEGRECDKTFTLPEAVEVNGIEFIILKLHERWTAKHHQLLESNTYLQNKEQLCRDLESRLTDAQEKLAELESRASSENGAARLTQKQADNDALFRATAELANTNVVLQNEIDDLQEKLSAKPEKDEVVNAEEQTEERTPAPVEVAKPTEMVNAEIHLKKKYHRSNASKTVTEKGTLSWTVKQTFSKPEVVDEVAALSVAQEKKGKTPVLPPVTKDPKEALKKLFGDDAGSDWGWGNSKQEEAEKSGADLVWGAEDETQETSPSKTSESSTQLSEDVIPVTKMNEITEREEPSSEATTVEEWSWDQEESVADSAWNYDEDSSVVSAPPDVNFTPKATTPCPLVDVQDEEIVEDASSYATAATSHHPKSPKIEVKKESLDDGGWQEKEKLEDDWSWNEEPIPIKKAEKQAPTQPKEQIKTNKKSISARPVQVNTVVPEPIPVKSVSPRPAQKKQLPSPKPVQETTDEWGAWDDEVADPAPLPKPSKSKTAKKKQAVVQENNDDWGW